MIFPLRCRLQAFPNVLLFICSVMLQLLSLLQPALQSGNIKGNFDTVPNGIHPSHFLGISQLPECTLPSFAISVLTKRFPSLLHCGLEPVVFSNLTEVDTLLVFYISTLASVV